MALILQLAAASASGNAFFGADPQPGSLTWEGFSDGEVVVTITDPGLGVNEGVYAGQFYGRFDPSSEGDGLGPDDFLRYLCVDITQLASGGPHPYTRILPALDPTKAEELARLFDMFYPNKTTGTYYASGAQTNFGDFPDANSSAAFQLAVWEIWFDSGLSLSGGGFTATSANTTMLNLAQSYLDAVDGSSGTPPGWTFYEFESASYQDYLAPEYSQPLRETPEPDSLLLFCSAALAAWAAALRRRQTA